jgi:aspartyl-tRNA(Asn)/glutamyl-tRNA(Gln) amidotransferase subunit C
MNITKDDIRKTAELARLEFTDKELDAFQEQFQKIIDYVGKIDALALDGVEPLTHLHDFYSNIRKDESIAGLPTAEALKNAPKKSDTYFKVPKVLESADEN